MTASDRTADDDLVYLGRDPLNAETRLERQVGTITPSRGHYVRDHFAIPAAPSQLLVDGAVGTPLRLALDELRAMPSRSLVVTLECAGNGRAFLEPPAPGEQWRLGAVGTAEWTGVPLRDILAAAAPTPNAVEVLFVGADSGTPKDLGTHIAFERSLPLADAHSPDVLLAYAMNGEPLTAEHGAPLRLVVPGWYGMASVKWLTHVRVLDHPFDGFFQKDRYVIDGRPLREIRPRAIITEPADGDVIRRGTVILRGYGWSGISDVERVEVSLDGGRTWRDAALGTDAGRYAWRPWELAIEPGGGAELEIVARAITRGGDVQPLDQFRNALGYGNNATRRVRVRIAPA